MSILRGKVLGQRRRPRRLLDFFGLVDERLVVPGSPSEATVTPEYGLFEHQRGAVQEARTTARRR